MRLALHRLDHEIDRVGYEPAHLAHEEVEPVARVGELLALALGCVERRRLDRLVGFGESPHELAIQRHYERRACARRIAPSTPQHNLVGVADPTLCGVGKQWSVFGINPPVEEHVLERDAGPELLQALEEAGDGEFVEGLFARMR